MAESISRCIRASEFKTQLAFARASGLSQSAVNDLCRGACVPQLSTLLKISLVAKVSTADLILGRTFEAEVETIPHHPDNNRLPAEQAVTKVAALARNRIAGRSKNVARSFKRLLKAEPPLPMAEIEKRLEINRRILSSRFADLYREAVTRYRAHTEKCRREFWEGVRGMLEKQLTEKAPLSVAKVARAVGRSREVVVRRFPELYVRLCDYRVERGKERWEAIEAFLRNSLGSTPPLRLRDVAKQLGLSHTSLYAHFPQLCPLVAERYERHLQQRRALKKESLRDEVIRIAKSLHEQGIYPSVREVSKCLLRPIYLRSCKVALATLRDVRSELGLSFKGEIPAGGTSE
jgi:transcriptional regulator with XRE-family HTH domain